MRLVARLSSWGALALSLMGATADAALTFMVDEPAVVDVGAGRGVPIGDESCDLTTVRALAGRHPDVRQFVLAATDSFSATTGTVEVAVRGAEGTWFCQRGERAAAFGRSGTRPLIDRRSGDGTTPAGVFPLGSVTAWDGQTFGIFGNRPDPGALAPYRSVRWEDCWGATPGASRYGHLVDLPGCGGSDEWLQRYGEVYAHAAVIGANLDPVSGDAPGETPYASAIFLHRHSYDGNGAAKPTSGCVSLSIDDLVDTVRLLDPRLSPHFAIGPRDWLRTSA